MLRRLIKFIIYWQRCLARHHMINWRSSVYEASWSRKIHVKKSVASVNIRTKTKFLRPVFCVLTSSEGWSSLSLPQFGTEIGTEVEYIRERFPPDWGVGRTRDSGCSSSSVSTMSKNFQFSLTPKIWAVLFYKAERMAKSVDPNQTAILGLSVKYLPASDTYQ